MVKFYSLVICVLLLSACQFIENSDSENDDFKTPNIPEDTQSKPQNANEIEFQVIECAGAGAANIFDQSLYLLSSQSDFERALSNANLNRKELAVQQIDFSQNSVIAVHLGERTNTGYDLEISKVTFKANENNSEELTVHFTEIQPSTNCAVGGAMTYPYCFISIEKATEETTKVDSQKEVKKHCGN